METRNPYNTKPPGPGPFLAKVISPLDPTYMGRLEVELLHIAGNFEKNQRNLFTVQYSSPFMGSTNYEHVKEVNDYSNTQTSYGMWMVPPDAGNTVVVMFINGDAGKGFWFGCVQDDQMNFQTPGNAATKFHVDGEEERVPVAEFNKKIGDNNNTDTTKNKKPSTPMQETLKQQGTLKDDVRGITSSSARRDLPSAVFGISTPGPLDKSGPKGKVGSNETGVDNAFVSRLPGSTFVMDDGDDKFVRKTKPSEGPPDYANKEDDETGIDSIPHNELIRFRTRTGHQILLHNSEDLIYVGNARGTAWIELTSDGKMDIFCEDSINIRTKNDFNFFADRDINLEAGRNVNIKANNNMQTEVINNQTLIVGVDKKVHIKGNLDSTIDKTHQHKVIEDVNFRYEANYTHYVKSNSEHLVDGRILQTSKANFEINSGAKVHTQSAGNNETKAGGQIIETASQIHMNGPGAATAVRAPAATTAELPKPLKIHKLPEIATPGAEPTEKSAIMRRVPTPEPYPHHENLDPVKYKKEQTDRDVDGEYEGESSSLKAPGEWYKKYSTVTDTFSKIGSVKGNTGGSS